jgi:hypothetical protein
MSPILNYVLPAMGVCRNFPRALVFSSTTHAGIGINHIHTVQEIARLKDILQHTYINSTTGLLYCTSLEYLILELGMGTNLTQIDFNKYQHLATNCLLKSTWEFIYIHKITLQRDITVPKNTSQDVPLMPIFCSLDPTTEELIALNQCRIYLKAYHISDLVTASCKQISYHAWEGKCRLLGNTTDFIGPTKDYQVRPRGKYGAGSLNAQLSPED